MNNITFVNIDRFIMAIVLLIIVLMTIINCPTLNGIDIAAFQQEALTQHNYYRTLHCSPPMTLNATINNIAQNYSNYLASNKLFQHSGTSGLGENLWSSSSSVVITYVNGIICIIIIKRLMLNINFTTYFLGSSPVASWYNEISKYDYNNPGFSSGTGHFTQVVWKDSVQLGIGIGFSNDSKTVVVTANYSPPGNYAGEYTKNVPQLCSGAVGGD